MIPVSIPGKLEVVDLKLTTFCINNFYDNKKYCIPLLQPHKTVTLPTIGNHLWSYVLLSFYLWEILYFCMGFCVHKDSVSRGTLCIHYTWLDLIQQYDYV